MNTLKKYATSKEKLSALTASFVNVSLMTRMLKKCISKDGDIVYSIRWASLKICMIDFLFVLCTISYQY